MRRLAIAAVMALGILGLGAGAASAQYVTQPGEGPQVGSAGFSGESAEVLGESVERENATGTAGMAGAPAEVAGVEDSRAITSDTEVRELSARTARASEAGESRSVLAFTGISLAVMLLVGGALIGIGAALRNRFSPSQTA